MKFSKEVKIGVFVVSVLVVSFFVINYLRGKDIFNKEIELVSRYDNVEGLVPSAPVFIKGYKAGKVAEVEYQPETDDFKVTCSVMKEFRIPSDSKMTIYAVDIMGGKGVKIDLGVSETLVVDGSELAPAKEAGLLDGLAEGVGPLLSKLGNTLDSLSVTVAGVNAMLSDSNQAAISNTLAHLERTMKSVNGIASTIDGKSAELVALVDNLASLSAKFSSIADKADGAMTGVSSIVTKIDETDIAGLVSSFKNLLEKINDPDGTVGKLLVDGSVYDSVDELLNDVDSLIKKIEENPKKYIKISVF
ncbi:MAG: MCE family protein [Bacteroidales bacterium]|nr:MCE family protein [Bacteroidales bacterium]